MVPIRHSVGRASVFIVCCLATMLLVTGCSFSFPWQHHTNAASANIPKPTSQQLLAALQKKFRSVSAFHVVLKTGNPGPATANQVEILNADGDIVMPDKIKAQASVLLSGQAVTIDLISIGSNQYITDPITGQWRPVNGILDPRILTDPNTGILSLVGKVQHLTQPTDDSVNGVPCWRVTGLLDAKELAFFTGGGVPAGTMLQTSACIGKADSLPYELKVTGDAAVGDTANTVRTFTMSNYNENVTITAPQV
jgi:LppX_LprAFG lipoprotein